MARKAGEKTYTYEQFRRTFLPRDWREERERGPEDPAEFGRWLAKKHVNMVRRRLKRIFRELQAGGGGHG